MKKLSDIKLTRNQHKALRELRQRLFARFEIEEIILFGSVARGEADEESDIDLLIITKKPFPNRFARHKITDVIFEVNFKYNTNFSSLVVDRANWEKGPISIFPIHQEILKEGIAV